MLTTLEQHRSKISENIGILRRTLDTFCELGLVTCLPRWNQWIDCQKS